MKLAMIGLGKMGGNMATRLVQKEKKQTLLAQTQLQML